MISAFFCYERLERQQPEYAVGDNNELFGILGILDGSGEQYLIKLACRFYRERRNGLFVFSGSMNARTFSSSAS